MTIWARLHERFGPVVGVMAAQGFATGAGALAGLFIVRALPPESYAQYSLGMTVLGAISALSDGGTTSGAMSEGGRAWGQPRRLAAVWQVAWSMRKRFGLWACGVALPILGWLLWQHGATAWEITAWVVVIAFVFSLNMRGALLEVPLKLQQALRVTQGAAVEQSVLRLFLVGASMLICPLGVMAALAGGVPQAWTNWRLVRAARQLNLSQPGTKSAESPSEAELSDVRAAIMPVVRRTVPGAIFYVVSSQAGTWFISVGGTTLALAQMGALGRISMLLGIVGSLCNAMWAPRFARITDAAFLRPVFFRKLGIALALCLPAIGVAAVWPSGLLWIVGPSYAGLESELQLAMIGAVVYVLGGVAFSLCYSRGWLPHPVLGIGTAVAVQGLSAWLLNVTTLKGVLWMSMGLGIQLLVLHTWYFLYRTRRPKEATS